MSVKSSLYEQGPPRDHGPRKRPFHLVSHLPICRLALTSNGDAGWSSPVARQAHNLKVTGSNPVPATKYKRARPRAGSFIFSRGARRVNPHQPSATRPCRRRRSETQSLSPKPNHKRPAWLKPAGRFAFGAQRRQRLPPAQRPASRQNRSRTTDKPNPSPQNQTKIGPPGSNQRAVLHSSPMEERPATTEANSESRIGAATATKCEVNLAGGGYCLGQPQCSSARFYDGEWIVGVVDRGPGSSIAPASTDLGRYLGCAESANQALRNNPNQRQSTAESASSGNR
ncbi:hypothetical protein ACVINZ_003086 [Mesorhizobium jarvisii]